MIVYKCKMCGGDLNIQEGMTVCECEYCGTKQTVPTVDDERKANLFNRATQLRQASEFDRAISVYEQLIADFPNESEAYWGSVLCKYGIEYVDDPRSYRKIPTCHRTSYDSIFNDVNYQHALKFADSISRSVYEREAENINDIQKGILRIAKNETPFDVFICYKETDDLGNRTEDSTIAQDLYDKLTADNLKVFFARITLEDKLGSAYEPYIFAALNSAKVMTVFGTKKEYFDSVWLKNEWMRFLTLMKTDKNKVIIPVYKNMSPHDLPDALAMFQAQDMSKLGFMQDIVRGIKKIINVDSAQQHAAPSQVLNDISLDDITERLSKKNAENILKRGFIALESKEWAQANKFFDEVLNSDPENSEAYFGKLMADCKLSTEGGFNSFDYGSSR